MTRGEEVLSHGSFCPQHCHILLSRYVYTEVKHREYSHVDTIGIQTGRDSCCWNILCFNGWPRGVWAFMEMCTSLEILANISHKIRSKRKFSLEVDLWTFLTALVGLIYWPLKNVMCAYFVLGISKTCHDVFELTYLFHLVWKVYVTNSGVGEFDLRSQWSFYPGFTFGKTFQVMLC